jgi:hypothetical protein
MALTEGTLSREKVDDFLSGLLRHLQSRLPEKGVIDSQVARLLSGKESQAWERRPEGRESAFIGEYVLPNVEEFLRSRTNDSLKGDPLSVIRVGFAAPKKYMLGGSSFFPGHPFGKVIRKPEVIYARWKGEGKNARFPLIQAFPDFTLLSPYRILFECKYFKTHLKSPAKVQLVKDLYETFFYLALPLQLPKAKHAGWDYDFACYLAYDATDDGWLFEAWNGLPERVRNSFWEYANIFVMMLPKK